MPFQNLRGSSNGFGKKKNVCCLNSHPKHNQIIQVESPDRPLKIPVC